MVTTRRGKEENTTAPYHAELQQRPKGSSSEALSGGINKKQWVATRGQASSQSVTCCSARNVGRRTGDMDANDATRAEQTKFGIRNFNSFRLLVCIRMSARRRAGEMKNSRAA